MANRHFSTPRGSPPERAELLALRTLAQRFENELLAALDTENPAEAVDRLETISECRDQLEEELERLDVVALQPTLTRLGLGLDRLACELYRRGGWAHLNAAQHRILLTRHARGLTQVKGVGPATAQLLFSHGISDPERLYHLEPNTLDDVTGLNAAVLARLKRQLGADRKTSG